MAAVLFVFTIFLPSSLSYGDSTYNNRATKDHHRNITRLLDSLLDGYNKHLRPGFGGPPLWVDTNILIRSMGPISEDLMMFSMDCYFRQYWLDPRLKFEPISGMDISGDDTLTQIDELRPSIKMLDEIWKPDTFFLNGKKSYLHTITYSNKLFRIKHNGYITYSQRLTIKAACPLELTKYPMDNQTCPVLIGSCNRTVLTVDISLKREIGYYLLQIYLPCYLIVIISWVSFWINREATPARVTLGITTLLTTCTIAITGRTGIPKVSYSTALDIYLLLCFGYVFATLVQFAGVSYFTKGSQADFKSLEDEENDLLLKEGVKPNGPGRPSLVSADINGHAVINVGLAKGKKDNCWTLFLHCLQGSSRYRHVKNRTKGVSLSVSRIDTMSRIMFPVTFVISNIVYWTYFYYLK